MSVQFNLLQPNLAETTQIQDQGIAVRNPDALLAFFQENCPQIDLSQDPEGAIEALDEMDVPFKYQLLTHILTPYTRVGNIIETAQKIVLMLVDRGYLYHASVVAASQVLQEGLRGPICCAVESTLEEEGNCVEEIDDLRQNFPVVENVMSSLRDKDCLEEMLALVPWILRSDNRDEWSEYLVGKLSLKGRIDEARSMLLRVESDAWRERATVSVIRALVKAGDCEEAIHLSLGLRIGVYRDAARSLTSYLSMINALCKMGRLEGAVELFDGITVEEELALAAQPLLRAMIDANRLKEAAKIALRITNIPTPPAVRLSSSQTSNNPTLCDIKRDLIEALVNANLVEEAQAIFLGTSGEKQQAIIGVPTIVRFIEVAGLEEAKAMLLESTNNLFKDKGMVVIIKAMVDEGRLEEATPLLKEIIDPDEKAQGLLLILEGYMRRGLIGEAYELFQGFEILNPQILYPALRELIEALITMGEEGIANAAHLAWSIPDISIKILLAIPILEVLIEKGELEEVERILMRISGEEERAFGEEERVSMGGKCLNEIKLKLAEKWIRRNDCVSFTRAHTILDQAAISVSSHIPVIKAWKDVGAIAPAVDWLKHSLRRNEFQESLVEITIEVLEELVRAKDFKEIAEINALIVDEFLEKEVAPSMALAKSQADTDAEQSTLVSSEHSAFLVRDQETKAP